MTEGRSANYNSCCRLCLSDKYNTLKSIFEDEAESRTLAQKILHFLGLEVSSNDKISTMICTQCLTKVNNWDYFKKQCSENQTKLQEWLTMWNSGGSEIANVSLQIKDEPVDHEENQRQQQQDGNDFLIKSEPIVEIEEFYESPPLLTPNPPEVSVAGDDDESQISLDELHINGLNDDGVRRQAKKCSFCNKEFSTVGNRMKHERIIHSNRRKVAYHASGSVTSHHDESSQHSMESLASSSINTEESILPIDSENEQSLSEHTETDMQKIQFAAGLRLKQTSAPVLDKLIEGPLSKLEVAYLDRCKAMVSMLHSFKCSCHNVSFPTIKRLFAHLRMSYTWFPIFTCYNCVITFSNRSGSMRHTGKCPKQYLDNIIRMAEMGKRMESKIRIYQYSKCMKCLNLYSFYEDYCEHIDKEHMTEPPYVCTCSKEFGSAEEFKQHVYRSCYLNYYCDVCYSTFESLNDFKTHCESTHDNVEEYSFVTFDAAFKLVNHEEIVVANKKRVYEEVSPPDLEAGEEDGNDSKKYIMSSRVVYQEPANCEICDRRFSNYYMLKKHMKGHRRNNFSNGWKNKPSNCDKCGKVFSTYYNMLRHKRIHDESEKNLQCALCSDRFRLVSQLKDHLILVHGQANVCQECGRQFESVEELDQHRSVHLNIKVYRDSKTDSYRTATQHRLSCEICDRCFENETELHEHILMHDTMPVLDAEGERQHEVEDKKDFGKFSCVECERHYVSYKGLWLHNKRHHPDRKRPLQQPYQCKYCDRILQTNAAYQMHKQMHERMLKQGGGSGPSVIRNGDEEEESYHTCKHCFKVFSSKYNLKNHLKTHGINISPGRSYSKTGKFVKTFWCDTCHQACQGILELQKHKQEHIDEKKRDAAPELENEEERDQKPHLFPCDICTVVFTSKFAVKKHKEKHDMENQGPEKHNFVYCKYCKIPFLDVDALNNHMELEHEETMKAQKLKKEVSKKFVCNLCKKVFDTAGALCSHQGWHKRGKADKQLKSQQKLFRKVVHSIPKPTSLALKKHECSSCSLMFLSDTALQIHILEAHRNINATVVPPRCTICNLDFNSQEAYENHSRLHKMVDSSKAFPCKYCNKGFSRSDSLNAHIRQFHNEHLETSFRCHQCDRIFEKQNALTIHLKVHERQKVTGLPVKQAKTHLYSCSICHLGFDIPKDLRNHIITSHPF